MTETPSAMFEIAGLIGVALYLGSYAALQFGMMSGNSNTYTLLNLGGASFVLVSLLTEFNLASALIQISWVVISLTGLTRMFLMNRRLRFSEDEEALVESHLPLLSKISARKFLDAGTWVDVPDEDILLVENKPVCNLIYLSAGGVKVVLGGQYLADVSEGFLGELNVLQGTPASATVTTTQPSRLFVISRAAVTRLMKSDRDFRVALESSLSRDTVRKLVAANRRLVATATQEPF